MRVTVTAGDRQVDIAIKGQSADKLRAVEETAHRLLQASQAQTSDDKPPFGYSATSDTERAPEE